MRLNAILTNNFTLLLSEMNSVTVLTSECTLRIKCIWFLFLCEYVCYPFSSARDGQAGWPPRPPPAVRIPHSSNQIKVDPGAHPPERDDRVDRLGPPFLNNITFQFCFCYRQFGRALGRRRLREPLVLEGLPGGQPLGPVPDQQLPDKVLGVLGHGLERAVLERKLATVDVVHGGQIVPTHER